MGIAGGNNFYHSIKHLELCDVIKACRIQSACTNIRSACTIPSIYIDCNWVGNYLGRSRGNYVRNTVEVIHIFSKVGFLVYPVIDGDVRHHTKQVSVGSRKLDREIARVDVLKIGQKLWH